jgi:hypothetical protein
MESMRFAIESGTFAAARASFLATYQTVDQHVAAAQRERHRRARTARHGTA